MRVSCASSYRPVGCVRFRTTFMFLPMTGNESSARVGGDERPKHAELTEQAIRSALAQKGVASASHANALAETFNITPSQVRRKLRFGIWTLQELLVLQDRIGVSLSSVLHTSGDSAARSMEPGVLLINGQEVECQISPGPVMTAASQAANLACSRHQGRWLISTCGSLEAAVPGQLRYAVELLQILDGGSPLRIAVLDDDLPAAESLAMWFSESGYPAMAFSTTQELVSAGIGNFDAFVLDVMLKSGTSYDLIGKIREIDANAVITLLTGKVRGNTPLESEMAEVVRDQKVEFAVKPTSPPLLLASILSSVARRRT